MKCKFLLRSMSVIFCIATLLSICSCGTKDAARTSDEKVASMELMEEEEVYTYGFDFLGGTDVMPLQGYYGPTVSDTSINGIAMPDYIEEDVFAMIAEAGINFINSSFIYYDEHPEAVIKTLEYGEKYGIGFSVSDHALPAGREYTPEEIDARINEYANYPAFCGIHGVDEPVSKHYAMGPSADISAYASKINAAAELDVWSLGNLLPNANETTRERYNAYVEEWLDSVNIKMLMYDHYVHDKDVETIDYFWSLSYARDKANEYKLPFWVAIQAGSHWSNEPIVVEEYFPNEGEMLWNINTSLAYGAKGISYFPLLQPYYFSYDLNDGYDFERNGIIGAAKNRTRWFYYAQVANKQIAAMDHVLMNAVHKGIILTSARAREDNADSSCIMEGTSWRELQNITGDVMVGCFNYKRKSAFFVVNYDMEYAQDITMDFNNNYKFSVIQKGETSKYQGNAVTLTMRPGEGVLVVME